MMPTLNQSNFDLKNAGQSESEFLGQFKTLPEQSRSVISPKGSDTSLDLIPASISDAFPSLALIYIVCW